MKKKTIVWLIVLVALCSAISAGIWVYNFERAKDNNSLFTGETLEVKSDTGNSVGRNTVLTFCIKLWRTDLVIQEKLLPLFICMAGRETEWNRLIHRGKWTNLVH